MSRQTYFAKYVSPNIIIVPTVSFSLPLPEKNTDPNGSLNSQQNTVNSNDISISREPSVLSSGTNYCGGSQCVEEIVDKKMKIEDDFIGTSDPAQNLPIIKQELVLSECPSRPSTSSTYTSHGIKELSSFKYKSRNNLVDLTGFNIIKKDSPSSLIKHKDSRHEDKTKVNQNIPDTQEKEENLKYSDTKDNTPLKNILRRSSERDSSEVTKENVKKYFRHLWRRNYDKIKEKSMKEKIERDFKSSRTKDSKLESRQSDAKCSKNISQDIKEYNDLKKKFIAEFTRRSKSETKSSVSSDKRKSIQAREEYLSSVTMKKYEDFQRFIRDSDNNKYSQHNSVKQSRTESLHDKTQKTSVTTRNIPDPKTIDNKDNYKQSVIKTSLYNKANIDLNNMGDRRMEDQKGDLQISKDNSQTKYKNEKYDLRTKLSRKRTRSECYAHSKQVPETQEKRENLVITIQQQDMKTDPKISAKCLQNVKKPRTKKHKKIKLVINIECPSSADSDDSDEIVTKCCPSPQDLSFLDDFNVDEIVDSLNHSLNENKKIDTKDNVIKQENDKKIHTPEEAKPKDRLINDFNIKPEDRKKTAKHNILEENVIVLVSDTENDDLFNNNRSLNSQESLHKQSVKEYLKFDSQAQEACYLSHEGTNVIDINTLQDSMANNDKSSKRKHKTIKLTNDIKHKSFKDSPTGKSAVHQESNHDKNTPEIVNNNMNKTINKIKDIKSSIKSNKCTKTIKKKKIPNILKKTKQNISKETVSKYKEPISSKKSEDPIEVSLKTLFSNIDKNTNKIISKSSSASVKQIKKENKKINLQQPEDSIEVSLETMFNKSDEKTNKVRTESSNEIEKHIRKETNTINLKRTDDPLEISLKTLFNNIKQEVHINMETDPSNILYKHKKKESDAIKASFKSLNDIIEQKPENVLKINKSIKHVEKKSEIESAKQKEGMKIDMKPLCTSSKNIKSRAKDRNESSKSSINTSVKKSNKNTILVKDVNCNTKPKTANQDKYLSRSNKGIKEKSKHSLKSYEPTKKMQETPITPTDGSNVSIKNNRGKETKSESTNKKSPKMPTNNNEKSHDSKIGIRVSNNNVKEKIETRKSINATEKSLNIVEQNASIQLNVVPLNKPIKNIKQKEPKNFGKKSLKTTSRNDEKNNSEMDINPLKVYSDDTKTAMDLAKPEDSKNTIKTVTQTKTEIKIDFDVLRVKKSLEIPNSNAEDKDNSKKEQVQNINNETITENIRNFKDSAKEFREATKSNVQDETQIKINTESLNISDKNTKETFLQRSEITNENLHEIADFQNSTGNIQPIEPSDTIVEGFKSLEKSEATTEQSLPIARPKVCSLKKYDNTVKEGSKSDTAGRPAESVNVNNNKTATSNVNISKTGDVCIDITKKDAKLKERIYFNEDKVTSNTENTLIIQKKDEAKSKNVLSPEIKPFVEELEARMLNYLQQKYTVTSIIHRGRYSFMYKCENTKGKVYAVKQLRIENQYRGMRNDRMLTQLQQCESKDNSSILYMLNSFRVNRAWCFLTDYYPKNLKQALHDSGKSFHIDLVQVLSRQLVAAVSMLTNHNIIHADIKPSHILLNSANDRLKLCGIDAWHYRDEYNMNIKPCAGTANYRAPEIILGFPADFTIDVWSTALVMFEMATSIQLFPGFYNNDILYKQMRTFGSFDMDMIIDSKFRHLYFNNSSFIRIISDKLGKRSVLVHSFQRNSNVGKHIYMSYRQYWEECRTRWQVTEDLDKLETFHRLLEQMLTLDPRYRLPIQFVSANEFIKDVFA